MQTQDPDGHGRSLDVLCRVKNRRELNAKLTGATLGDDAGDEDTRKWIKKAKKREKELAKKRQQEQEHMDKMFQDDYTESTSSSAWDLGCVC